MIEMRILLDRHPAMTLIEGLAWYEHGHAIAQARLQYRVLGERKLVPGDSPTWQQVWSDWRDVPTVDSGSDAARSQEGSKG